LGRFYSNDSSTEQHDEDSDRHYAQLLYFYGDADECVRKQCVKNEVKIYHEKQRLSRCGLHSLNNLFQIPKLFTYHYLETIVREYDKRTFFNDYRTLWLGDYDLRILIEAINRHGFSVRQINIYQNESISNLPWDSYFGLLINLNGAHWFTIKNVNGIYYNLDSTLRKPIEIGKKEHLIQYLYRIIYRTRTVYLFVVSQQIN
jgi:josephin